MADWHTLWTLNIINLKFVIGELKSKYIICWKVARLVEFIIISSRKSKTDMQYNCQEKKYKRRTCNTMAKRKSTKDGHAIQWPREKVQKMDMQYNGQDKKNRQTTIYNTLHRNERSSNMNPNKIRG